jgi:DNA-binding NarL/FixJ family response regulator
MLAVRAPRAETTAVLANARSIALELEAEPLLASVDRLARIARLKLPATATERADQTDGAAVTPDDVDDPFGLTAREREVLVLLAEGQTNRRIADTLFISESTAASTSRTSSASSALPIAWRRPRRRALGRPARPTRPMSSARVSG